jgi:hypothetical protein
MSPVSTHPTSPAWMPLASLIVNQAPPVRYEVEVRCCPILSLTTTIVGILKMLALSLSLAIRRHGRARRRCRGGARGEVSSLRPAARTGANPARARTAAAPRQGCRQGSAAACDTKHRCKQRSGRDLIKACREQGHDREQREQAGRGARDRPVRPLALGLDAEMVAHLAERDLDGLITNDKFCLSRPGRLVLSWWRYPLRRREQEQAQHGAVPDTDGDRGGVHAAPLAGPSPDAAGRGRSTPMGSGLPADPQLEPAGRPASASASGHPLVTTTGGEP